MAICLLTISNVSSLFCHAQTQLPVSPPKPPDSEAVQDSLRVFIEEVRIPIAATDGSGRFDPTVGLEDLMVREDGVVQHLRSVYRVPANVLLMLDTGGEQNLSKSVRLTRDVAVALISSLRKEDQVAVMQVNNRVELVHDWSVTQSEVIQSVDNKLLPGKRSALVAAVSEAVEQFKKVPAGNNHLVIVSDGVEPTESQPRFDDAIKNLLAANITVHIISYTLLGRKVKWVSPSRPREKSAVDKHLIEALPSGRFKEDPTPDLKTLMQSKGGVVVDVDRLFRPKGIKGALKQREEEFVGITEETGGSVWLPTSADGMILQAAEVARDVDSHYVITYKPLLPLNSRTASEYRKIDVISRRVGLKVRARRGYVAKGPG